MVTGGSVAAGTGAAALPTLWSVEHGAGFDREAAERVLRRAVELSDRAQDDPAGSGISERALVALTRADGRPALRVVR